MMIIIELLIITPAAAGGGARPTPDPGRPTCARGLCALRPRGWRFEDARRAPGLGSSGDGVDYHGAESGYCRSLYEDIPY